MARFQSQLFNWLDNSLPAQLGRRARNWLRQLSQPVKQHLNKWAVSSSQPLLLKPVQTLVLWLDRPNLPGSGGKKIGGKNLTRSGSFDQVARLQELIRAAIAYFRKHFKNRLKPAPTPQLPPLTMMDLFGDDGSVWPPLPSTGAIASPRPTAPVPSPPMPTPLQAWIETRATFMGYVYPHRFIDWLDQLVSRVESWLAWLWQILLGLVKKLSQILRY